MKDERQNNYLLLAIAIIVLLSFALSIFGFIYFSKGKDLEGYTKDTEYFNYQDEIKYAFATEDKYLKISGSKLNFAVPSLKVNMDFPLHNASPKAILLYEGENNELYKTYILYDDGYLFYPTKSENLAIIDTLEEEDAHKAVSEYLSGFEYIYNEKDPLENIFGIISNKKVNLYGVTKGKKYIDIFNNKEINYSDIIMGIYETPKGIITVYIDNTFKINDKDIEYKNIKLLIDKVFYNDDNFFIVDKSGRCFSVDENLNLFLLDNKANRVFLMPKEDKFDIKVIIKEDKYEVYENYNFILPYVNNLVK